jgi:hypothetical protein
VLVSWAALFASEAVASERTEAFSRLTLSHMHYLKSCFAQERGDAAKAKDELRLAQVLDENSRYLRLTMQRREAVPFFAQERFRGELSSAQTEEPSRAASTGAATE